MGLSRGELINKLEKISSLHKNAMAIKQRMDNYVPEDNYERKVKVPKFPLEINNEYDEGVFNVLLNDIEHTSDDAMEYMSKGYDIAYHPKEPVEPTLPSNKGPDNSKSEDKKKKLGCFSYIAIAISIFFALGAIFGVDENTSDTLPTILVIAAVAAVAFFVLRFMIANEKKAESKKEADALLEYNKEVEKIKAKHSEALLAYEGECDSYKIRRQAFLDEYSKWRNIHLKSVKEENEIAEKLESDRLSAVEKIKNEELTPVLHELTEINDLITIEYLPAVDIIIDLLRSNRADDLKEAINLYEDIVYRERQLQLQREQEAQRQREEAMKREAEERHHREQMEFQKQQEYQRAYEAKQQLRMKEQQHKDEMKMQAERLKQEAAAAKASRQKRCVWCAHRSTCRQQYYDGAYNCTGFTPSK